MVGHKYNDTGIGHPCQEASQKNFFQKSLDSETGISHNERVTGTKTTQLLGTARRNGKPLTPRAKDSQRAKVYSAEQVIRGRAGNIGGVAANALAQKIAASKYVQNNYGIVKPRIEVSTRRTRTSAAFYWEQRIVLAAGWGCTTDVVIHEMAHLYASPAGDPGHDWLFCSIYLDLVRKFMGSQAHADLKASFKAHKVRFTPPKAKRQMTPAQKAAAVDRMAKARAARAGSACEPTVFAWYDNRFPGLERWERWVLVGTAPVRGNVGLTYRLMGHGNRELSARVLVRKTDKGVVDMLKRLRMGAWHDQHVLAVPAHLIPFDVSGQIQKDWVPADSLVKAAGR